MRPLASILYLVFLVRLGAASKPRSRGSPPGRGFGPNRDGFRPGIKQMLQRQQRQRRIKIKKPIHAGRASRKTPTNTRLPSKRVRHQSRKHPVKAKKTKYRRPLAIHSKKRIIHKPRARTKPRKTPVSKTLICTVAGGKMNCKPFHPRRSVYN